MALIGKIWTVSFLGVAIWAGCGRAQTLPQTQDALQAMAQQAGVIFTGQVTAVRQHDAVVEIDFAVKDAVRGVSSGSYTLREWAGLWPGGDEPFRAGQRYLMLLHSPGASGLSSPVGGMDGAIPIRGGASTAGMSTDGLVMDLGWVGTRVVRPTGFPLVSIARPILRPAAIVPIEGIPASAAKGASYTTVLGMLRSWEQGDHGAS
jgi:hypothetical protein